MVDGGPMYCCFVSPEGDTFLEHYSTDDILATRVDRSRRAQIETLVLGARDPKGNDIDGTRVLLDGAVLVDHLDGKPVPVDPGEHTIVFGLLGETIELTVRATSRDCYAHGALTAAKFLVGKPAGLYSMQDVLQL